MGSSHGAEHGVGFVGNALGDFVGVQVICWPAVTWQLRQSQQQSRQQASVLLEFADADFVERVRTAVSKANLRVATNETPTPEKRCGDPTPRKGKHVSRGVQLGEYVALETFSHRVELFLQ